MAWPHKQTNCPQYIIGLGDLNASTFKANNYIPWLQVSMWLRLWCWLVVVVACVVVLAASVVVAALAVASGCHACFCCVPSRHSY